MCSQEDEDFHVDSNGCFSCDPVPKVKGRFGLAWVAESPDCPCPEPVGWQVEFLDTPSKVEQKCQEMVRWINCPPLPRCDPCPPEELCCNTSLKKKCCCKKPDPSAQAYCSCQKKKAKKYCCCEKKRYCSCCRSKSPRGCSQ